MIYLFYTIHVIICLFLILVVLLQQGKGADLSVFGGGSTMTAFGARGAATLLHKMTVFAFIGFILTTLIIGILQGQAGSSSVMSGLEEQAAAATSTSDVEVVDEAAAGDAAEEAAEPVGLLQDAGEPADEGEAAAEGADDGDEAEEP